MAAGTPFLGSLDDTVAVIQKLRAELTTVTDQRAELDVKANDLTGRIAAFNTLRQAHGLPPL